MTQMVCCDRCNRLVAYDPAEHFYSDALCPKCLRDRESQETRSCVCGLSFNHGAEDEKDDA